MYNTNIHDELNAILNCGKMKYNILHLYFSWTLAADKQAKPTFADRIRTDPLRVLKKLKIRFGLKYMLESLSSTSYTNKLYQYRY